MKTNANYTCLLKLLGISVYTTAILISLMTSTFVFADEGSDYDNAGHLKWNVVHKLLNDKEVITVDDLFGKIVKLDISVKRKAFYSGTEAKNDYTTFDDYVAQAIKNDRDLKATADVLQKIGTDDKYHKKSNIALSDLARIYILYTKQKDWEDEKTNFGNPVFIRIYTDKDGNILGFRIPK